MHDEPGASVFVILNGLRLLVLKIPHGGERQVLQGAWIIVGLIILVTRPESIGSVASPKP